MVAGCPSLRCGPLLLWRQGVAGTGTQQMLGVVGQRPGRFVRYVLDCVGFRIIEGIVPDGGVELGW